MAQSAKWEDLSKKEKAIGIIATIVGAFILLMVIAAIFGGDETDDAASPEPAAQAQQDENANEATNEAAETEEAPEDPQTAADILPPRDEADSIARANAEEDWENDYEMVQYAYNNQMNAYDWLIERSEHLGILQDAVNDWGDDYEMVKYTYENQVKAYNELN